MAVTLMLFVKLPKAPTSARVKQALKEMETTAKVMSVIGNVCYVVKKMLSAVIDFLNLL